MKRFPLFLLFLLLALTACHTEPHSPYVVVRHGRFYLGDSAYRFLGANFWCGAILGSTGQGGDRARLDHELDLMLKTGITNVRVLAGGEGHAVPAYQIRPTMQPEAGVYNDTVLRGLDYLLSALEKRHMTAVLYLNNSWEWSGGYGQYLEWAGAGPVPSPKDWDAFLAYHCRFVGNAKATELALRHTRHIVTRRNTITGRPYTESPAILAWEIANEPRAFAPDAKTKDAFIAWIRSQAHLIKSLDKNHLVTTGSEGLYGCENDMELFETIHALPEIDYATIHIWPYNWNWLGRRGGSLEESAATNPPSNVVDSCGSACRRTVDYIERHLPAMARLEKPLVLEEFGYPRDNFSIEQGSSTRGRDTYYRFLFDYMAHNDHLAAICFWAWGGDIVVGHPRWQSGDAYTGDPAQEEQGMNAIFWGDATTLQVLRQGAKRL